MHISPRLRVRLAGASSVVAVVAAGCTFFSPSVPNNSTSAFPTPDQNGAVTVSFNPPADVTPSSVTFQIETPPSGAPGELVSQVSQNTPPFTATYTSSDLSVLPPGLQIVDIFYDSNSGTTPDARVSFLIPQAAAASAAPTTAPSAGS